MKLSFLAILVVFLGFQTILVGQQMPTMNTRIELIRNREVFFNPAGINPVMLTDSNLVWLDFMVHDQTIGRNEGNSEYLLKCETGMIPGDISVGLLFDIAEQGIINTRKIEGSFKKGFRLGEKSELQLGLNVGILVVRPDLITPPDPFLIDNSEWEFSPLIDIGASYQYRNHKIGLAYKYLVYTIYEKSIHIDGLILNYQGVIPIFGNISVIPEVYGCFPSDKSFAIIAAKLKFKHFVEAGVLFNTRESFGFMAGGTIINRIRWGYFFDYTDNDFGITMTHALNLGVKLYK